MRFKARGVFLALVAVFAMSAVAASAATAALPEFSKTPVKFDGGSGSLTFGTSSGAIWSCGKSSLEGEVTGPKTLTASLTIKECTILWGGSKWKCSNTSSPNEIKTNALTGTLGYVNKSKKEVGLSLQATSGETFAEFTCTKESGAKTNMLMKGALIGALTPVNEKTSNFNLTFEGSRGQEVIQRLEEGLENPFMVKFGAAEETRTSMAASENLTTAEKEEIKV